MKLETLPPALQTISIALFTLAFVAFVFALLGTASTIFKSKIGLASNNERRLSQGEKFGAANGQLH